jgi:hypothetical protein
VDRGAHDRAVEALCAPELAQIVDLVAWADRAPAGPPGSDQPPAAVVVANSRGAARLRPDAGTEVLWGADPVAWQDPMAFLPYDAERADPSPPNDRNAYPYAWARLSSFFSDRRAPDLAVVHTPRHFFPELGGHRGEHGSLDVVQSRAPLLVSGPGVGPRGLVDGHARLVDVAPTLARLAGVPARALAGLDGRALDELVAPAARWVVGVLLDGAHCGDLLQLTAEGRLPALARLLERGAALRGGAVAEFPSVTLTNHTSALTGVGPGRHGVIGNVYFDRDTGERVVPNDARTWHRSAEWLRPGVTTVFEHVTAARPGSMTACVNESVDRGATYSTMALIRASGNSEGAAGLGDLLPDPLTSPFATRSAVQSDAYYAWATQVDDIGVEQMRTVWERPSEAPALTWWAHTVTDAGHHAGGPRSQIARASLRDADARLGAFLDHLDRLGCFDDVVWLITADHGFEAADPACRGHWGEALRAAGVTCRDEGPGFLYLEEG